MRELYTATYDSSGYTDQDIMYKYKFLEPVQLRDRKSVV